MQKHAAARVAVMDVPDLRRSLARRTGKDIISGKIAGLIATGVLSVGDELPSERELAAALDVSRETVRGAIQILAERGVVDVSQGARTRVVGTDLAAFDIDAGKQALINRYTLESVHAARQLVERDVVGAAAERIDAEALARLRHSLAAQQACADDPVRFLICDREFHTTIYRACGNALLADMVTDLYGYMMEHRRRVMALPGAIARSFAEHARIVAALARHDRRATLRAFSAHADRIYRTTRAMLDGAHADPPAGPPRVAHIRPAPKPTTMATGG